VRDVRARIAFYASTPSYRAAFDHLGLGELADECKALSKALQWEELPQYISDDILHEFAVVGTHDEIGSRLLDRFGAVVTDVEFSIAVTSDAEKESLRQLAQQIQSADDAPARHNIKGLPFTEA